jgi:hypothetical protein
MKTFDRNKEGNLAYYNSNAYKVIAAGRAVDVGLYDEVTQTSHPENAPCTLKNQ